MAVNNSETGFTKLDLITTTIVDLLGKVTLFNYNKLAYLFEYFHIKNFASRFTGELFQKFPHGPVIKGYKEQITKLAESGYIEVDIAKLKKTRPVDGRNYEAIYIYSPEQHQKSFLTLDPIRISLLTKVVKKFGAMTSKEIEEAVYATEPIKLYAEQVAKGYRNEVGGYILKGDIVRMQDYKNDYVKGRTMAAKHFEKYPERNSKQEKLDMEDTKFFKLLRPSNPAYE